MYILGITALPSPPAAYSFQGVRVSQTNWIDSVERERERERRTHRSSECTPTAAANYRTARIVNYLCAGGHLSMDSVTKSQSWPIATSYYLELCVCVCVLNISWMRLYIHKHTHPTAKTLSLSTGCVWIMDYVSLVRLLMKLCPLLVNTAFGHEPIFLFPFSAL